MRLVDRLRSERGYSLVEMVTVLAIMSVILTSLTTLFVQGTHAEMDMRERFEAQQDARIALDKMRREIHCAGSAQTTGGTGQQDTITLRLQGQCPTAVGGVQTDVSWCSKLVPGSTTRYGLYRTVGSGCDTTGTKWADYLTQAAIFDYQTQSTTDLAKVRVYFPIDVDASDTAASYKLCDIIVLRNSTRTAPTSSLLGYADTAAPAACS